MTSEQTQSANKESVMWLTAPEQVSGPWFIISTAVSKVKNKLSSSATKVSGNTLAVIWLEFGGTDRWTLPTLPLYVVLFSVICIY